MLLIVATALDAAIFSGRVVGIADGDTIRVLHNGRVERFRLWGIDAPERSQPFGTRARQFTGDLAFRKDVKVIVHDADRYRPAVGEVILPDGRNLNQELAGAGLAWWYGRARPRDRALASLEAEARKARRGLWAGKNPVTLWERRWQPRRGPGQQAIRVRAH